MTMYCIVCTYCIQYSVCTDYQPAWIRGKPCLHMYMLYIVDCAIHYSVLHFLFRGLDIFATYGVCMYLWVHVECRVHTVCMYGHMDENHGVWCGVVWMEGSHDTFCTCSVLYIQLLVCTEYWSMSCRYQFLTGVWLDASSSEYVLLYVYIQ